MYEDDFALIKRIACGDHDALQDIYERYCEALYGYLWRRLNGNSMLIEEALQDVFVAVWQHAASFRGEAQVKTWLFRIAHGKAYHLRRSQSPIQTISLPEIGDQHTDFETPAFHLEDEILSRLSLNDAMNHLSEKHRDVLVLIFEQGFSVEEAASILDVPSGTVKSRISYARQALSHRLSMLASTEE